MQGTAPCFQRIVGMTLYEQFDAVLVRMGLRRWKGQAVANLAGHLIAQERLRNSRRQMLLYRAPGAF